MKTMIIYKVRNITKGLVPLFLLSFLIQLTSCSDFLEEYSQDLARVQTVDDLDELVAGDCVLPLGYIYTANSNYSPRNHNFDIVHFMGDELDENLNTYYAPYNSESYTTTYYPFFTWQKNCYLDYEGKSNLESNENQYWLLGYEKIGKCNMVLYEAENIGVADDNEMRKLHQVIGECHFLRANYYFMLVNLYAKPYAPATATSTPGIPIKSSPEIEDIEYSRNSVAEVYDFLISDLDNAEKHLQEADAPKNIYRASITAVYLFRSRIAAFMQNWEEAANYARKALEKKNSLQDLRSWGDGYPISDKNPEVIHSNGSSCFGNTIYYRPQSENYYEDTYTPFYTISEHLVGLYDDNDGRKGAYITNEDDISNHCWSYKKIDNSLDHYSTIKAASDVFCLRTAEAYLLLAEAEAHLGNDAEACRQLNLLRAKRIEDVENVSLSGENLINFIREERERELCLEGHRWFDLRRYQVDTKYPYSKTIEHTFSKLTQRGYYELIRSEISYYRLEPNDEAYTLDIPKTVRDYQPSIGSNERPDRLPYDVKINND